jgi:sugar lactone lactonase YvrE
MYARSKRLWFRAAIFLMPTTAASGQNVITTVAGTDFFFPSQPIFALSAPLGAVIGVATDSAGNRYFSDRDNNLILKVDRRGILSVFAGNGSAGFSGDGGTATSASLASPNGIALDTSGNLYICDTSNNRIRRVAPNGIITTIAGSGIRGFSGDGGPAYAASLAGPRGVAVDGTGNFFIADAGNHRIRRVSAAGLITTIAGSGSAGFSGDPGPATSAALNLPTAVAVDAAGRVLVADYGNQRVRAVQNGTISTLVGTGKSGDVAEGTPALMAPISSPAGIAVDSAGNLLIADQLYNTIWKVNAGGIITTFAGINLLRGPFDGDGGLAIYAALFRPEGVTIDSGGAVSIADTGNLRVRQVTTDGTISTIAGAGYFRFGGDGAEAANAYLHSPQDVLSDAMGNLYIADSENNRVRKVSPDGTIKTIAGGGLAFPGNGGQATNAALISPVALNWDREGNLLIAEEGNGRILKVSQTGVLSTVIRMGQPVGVAATPDGGVIYSDVAHVIRKVAPDGTLTTIAGNGKFGFSGDGGPATAASLYFPTGLVVDSAGNIFVADYGNSRIRRITPAGIITTVAGNGTRGYSGDGGPATSASLLYPTGVRLDAAGTLWIADSGNSNIRRIMNGVITTVVGSGRAGLSGDGVWRPRLL